MRSDLIRDILVGIRLWTSSSIPLKFFKRFIKKEIIFVHGTGICISERAIIENGVYIYQNVTIGSKYFDKQSEAPTIRKNAVIYSNAIILGGVTIGESARIGAGAVITKDIPPNTTAINEIRTKYLKCECELCKI